MTRRQKRRLYGLGAFGVVAGLVVYGVVKPKVDSLSVSKFTPTERVYEDIMRHNGYVRLDAEELRGLLDHTFYESEGVWVIYYAPTGEGRLRFSKRRFPDGTRTDTGHREITDDGRYCTTWEKLRDGAKRCGRVWKVGDLYYGMLKDGYIGSRYRVRPGKVENL